MISRDYPAKVLLNIGTHQSMASNVLISTLVITVWERKQSAANELIRKPAAV